mgnify:CR=1 FL=1
MRYAVVDISSTSISLLVAEGEGRVLDVVLKERENLSMLHYLEERELSGRGLEKLTDALMRVRTTLKNLEVDRAWLISTAAMRGIRNFDEVSAAVAARTGMPVNLIDGNTEAYCDYVSNQRYAGYDRALLLDIGGGSVEVCDFSKPAKEEMICLNFGLMGLSRRFVKGIHPTEEEARRIKKYVLKQADESGLPKKDVFKNAVLVGSILNAVYAVYADYFGVKGEEKRIEYKKLKALTRHLVESSDRSMLILKNAPEKLYVLVTACVVLKTLLKRFDVTNILVSDLGVKEGYLQLVLSGEEQGLPIDLGELPEPEPKADRIRVKKAGAAKAGGRRSGKAGTKGVGKKKGETEGKTAGKASGKKRTSAEKAEIRTNEAEIEKARANEAEIKEAPANTETARKKGGGAGKKRASAKKAETSKAQANEAATEKVQANVEDTREESAVSGPAEGAGTLPAAPEGSKTEPHEAEQPDRAPRRRGRPKGSKNRPKAGPEAGTEEKAGPAGAATEGEEG